MSFIFHAQVNWACKNVYNLGAWFPMKRVTLDLVVLDRGSIYCPWAWRPRWLWNLGPLNKFLCPQPQEALHEIWIQLVQWFLRTCLKSSKYMSLGKKVKEWPWPFILTDFHIFIKTYVYTYLGPKSPKLSLKSCVLAISYINLSVKCHGQPNVIT